VALRRWVAAVLAAAALVLGAPSMVGGIAIAARKKERL